MFIELLHGLYIGSPFLLCRFLRCHTLGPPAIPGSIAALSCGVSAALFLGVWLVGPEGISPQTPGLYARQGRREMSATVESPIGFHT
jgi:hypothetical protein